MRARSIPSVTLYIRITDENGNRRYERVNRRKPQLSGGIYCLHFCTRTAVAFNPRCVFDLSDAGRVNRIHCQR